MAKRGRKRRTAYARKSGRWRRFRVRRPKTIPILPITGFGAGLIAGQPFPGWSSPIEGIMRGEGMIAVQSAIANLTGLGVPMPQTGYSSGPIIFNLGDTLNPFNLNNAAALKGLIWGSVASMVLRAIGVNRKFREATKSIPIIKKFSL